MFQVTYEIDIGGSEGFGEQVCVFRGREDDAEQMAKEHFIRSYPTSMFPKYKFIRVVEVKPLNITE